MFLLFYDIIAYTHDMSFVVCKEKKKLKKMLHIILVFIVCVVCTYISNLNFLYKLFVITGGLLKWNVQTFVHTYEDFFKIINSQRFFYCWSPLYLISNYCFIFIWENNPTFARGHIKGSIKDFKYYIFLLKKMYLNFE